MPGDADDELLPGQVAGLLRGTAFVVAAIGPELERLMRCGDPGVEIAAAATVAALANAAADLMKQVAPDGPA